VGIVSSGKGCGVYPGLYTEVSRYSDWIEANLAVLENEVS
jgi:secreted trypsin-like serine protease